MPARKTNPWVSCYVYYTASPDKLLAGSVRPLVQRLTGEQLTKQFFFIRYHDRQGPHIRLRLLPDQAASRQVIERELTATFPKTKFAAYVPETKRYGGPAGLPIAEVLFEASSTAVLRLLAGEQHWNYRRALASALQMHIGMLQAFGVSRAETVALFKHIAQSRPTSRPAADRTERFEQEFTTQRQTIVPALTALWDACQKNTDFQERWFNGWRQSMAGTGTELRQAHNRQRLLLPESSVHDSPLWSLYESYIHMTNNRLGVAPVDEPFVAYLLQRSLEES